ncbi:MAG: EF-P lysine aminoacylase EpmA [Lentisphaerota bacterium]
MKSEKDRLQTLRAVLEKRALILRAIRRFFEERNFLEVETPIRIPSPPPEVHIDAEPSGGLFLRSSPELHMKRMLAAGYPRIFQMGACFRQGEFGVHHNPEYTMLEWYRADADYTDILLDAKALILFVAQEVLGGVELSRKGGKIDLGPVWERLTVSQAFIQFAGWDPVAAFDADRFDLDLVEKVEPALPKNVPVVLADYPAPTAALARRKPGQPEISERWELYIAGVELANAYSELTDPDEQEIRFTSWNEQRSAMGKEAYPIDQLFLEALRSGMPPSGGIALGVDRLVMLLTGAPTLDEVLPFRD